MDSKQEYLMKLQVLEQEANQMGEQLKLVEQQINELDILKVNLEKLEKAGEEEIFAELGKGIFVKAKLKKSDLLIDVGSKVLVPKSYNQIKDVIKNQTSKSEQVRVEVGKRIEQINTELNRLIEEADKSQNQESQNKSSGKEENAKENVKINKIVVKKKRK